MNPALLLTDAVDSTKLSEQLGDAAMAALWARHDRVARDLLPVHNGREIDKTDGFLMLFEAASEAVAYALAYHRAIGALDPPLKARAGLHVGPVILTENSPADVARGAKPLEVDGLAKPTAARIMGLASDGQTLLSAEARAALGATPLRVESHGHYREDRAGSDDNRRLEGNVLGALSLVHQWQGRIDEARAHVAAALAIQREVGNRRAEGALLANLGTLDMDQGLRDAAGAHYDAALVIHREVGNHRSEGTTLCNLGALFQAQGRMDEASAHYDAALAIARAVGERRSEGIALSSLGELNLEQGRMDLARAHYDAALVVAREVSNRTFEGYVLGRLGLLRLAQGRLDEARTHLREGEHLLRETRAPLLLAELLCGCACLEAQAGDLGAARGALSEARDLADRLGTTPDSSLGRALARARAALGRS